MNRDQLLEVLDTCGVPAFQRDAPGGGTLVAMRRGARVVGLFPRKEGTSTNTLWINPEIEAILNGTAKDWVGAGEGSVGGDRLWISPERNFYYRNPREFQEWFTPVEMDPGAYEEKGADRKSVTYENRCDLQDLLGGRTLRGLVLRRTLALLENPLIAAQDLKSAWRDTGYVGVDSQEVIEMPEETGRALGALRICPWGLTQVLPPAAPRAGTVVVPTARRAQPIGYFGPIPPDRLRVSEDHVSFRIDAKMITKLGVRAEDVAPSGPVRIAYVGPAAPDSPDAPASRAADWVLLVRESSDVARSSADAVDPAKADPDGPRGVVQSYNNGPGPSGGEDYARFGEIEMQYLPLKRDAGGTWRSVVTTRLMAYQGNKDTVQEIVRRILGLDALVLFD